ncbi:hypothetical protein OFL98_30290, partial [Escherichia coli]|nr:hypothetical protein [Escherichia coli]
MRGRQEKSGGQQHGSKHAGWHPTWHVFNGEGCLLSFHVLLDGDTLAGLATATAGNQHASNFLLSPLSRMQPHR